MANESISLSLISIISYIIIQRQKKQVVDINLKKIKHLSHLYHRTNRCMGH